MKQYCRHCAFCIEGDCYYCTDKDKVLSESYIKHTNTCKDFALSELGDVITGKKYTPHKIYHGKQIDGQMSLGDYDDAGILNQFDNLTGSMNL